MNIWKLVDKMIKPKTKRENLFYELGLNHAKLKRKDVQRIIKRMKKVEDIVKDLNEID